MQRKEDQTIQPLPRREAAKNTIIDINLSEFFLGTFDSQVELPLLTSDISTYSCLRRTDRKLNMTKKNGIIDMLCVI